MLIGELSIRTKTSARSLRHYELQGLLTPSRTENGYRSYTAESIRVVQRVRWLLSAGVTTRVIRDLLPCLLEEDPEIIRCPKLRSKLKEEVDRIDAEARLLKKSAALIRSALRRTT